MKLYKKNIARENLELLTRNQNFINLVSDIRAKFDIPSKGFQTNAEMAKWNEKSINNYESKANIVTDALYGITITKEQKNQLEILLRRFRLSNFYVKPLLGFLLYNKFNFSPFQIKSSNVGCARTYDVDNYPHHKITIEIFPETTPEDIEHIWPQITKMKKQINKLNGVRENKRNSFTKNLDIHLFIWDLYKQGKTDKETKKEIENRFRKTIPYSYIPIYRKRIKRKIEQYNT